MNTLLTLAMVSTVSLGAAAPAEAFTLAPPNTAFSTGGPVEFVTPGTSLECTLSMRGVTTRKGDAKITSAFFTSNGSGCATTVAVGLPWEVHAISAGKAKIKHFTVITPFGTCGPSDMAFFVSLKGPGVWTFSAPVPPACARVESYLPTTPKIVIVP
jgi:hypothetical protein